MDRDIKEEIKKLVKEKRYDDVYYKYTSKAYIKYVPRKIRKKKNLKIKQVGMLKK